MGRVVDADGLAWSGPFWLAVGPARDDGLAEAPAGLWRFPAGDGGFSVEIRPGSWRLLAGADGRAPSVPVVVSAESAAGFPEVSLALSKGRTLRGRLVLAPADRPLAHVELVARDTLPAFGPGGPAPASTATDAGGAFVWSGLPESCKRADVMRAGSRVGTLSLPATGDGELALLRLDDPGAEAALAATPCK